MYLSELKLHEATKELDIITAEMQRYERHIDIQSKSINAAGGERKCDPTVLKAYRINLNEWDMLKNDRDKIKIKVSNCAKRLQLIKTLYA